MGFSQQQHAQTALTDAAADGVGQLARQQRLVEGQFSAVVAARDGELSVQTFGGYADAHAGDLDGVVQDLVPEQDVAVEFPVVVVRGSAVVGLAAL